MKNDEEEITERKEFSNIFILDRLSEYCEDCYTILSEDTKDHICPHCGLVNK